MPSPTPQLRDSYPHHLPIATRWMDNDVYGHDNNVVYYSYFDTVINRWLVDEGGLDIGGGDCIGLCVESRCAYLRPLAFPDALEGGLRVVHLGRSSVRYEIAIFAVGNVEAAAQGEFVHVFVDRATRRPAEMPPRIRDALARLMPR
ncbi:MAG: thioesterase [Myxococcales bacterium]|nr:thioesterase [Myxococcales bacterium]